MMTIMTVKAAPIERKLSLNRCAVESGVSEKKILIIMLKAVKKPFKSHNFLCDLKGDLK